MKTQWKQNLCALLAAFIWGTAFVAQSISSELVEPFTFNAVRSAVAVAALGGFLLVRRLFAKKKPPKKTKKDWKNLWLGGLVCGGLLTVAANMQQMGIGDSGAGKAGFITALYIVLVPLLGLFFRKKVPFTVWIAVGIAVFGLYFLCVSGGFAVALSDLCLLLCALAFACQILAVDAFSQTTDGVELSFMQFVFLTLFSAIVAFFAETPDPAAILQCIWPILYVGIFSGGVAYTLQIVAQKDANPTVISLLLSLEAFFSVVAGAILLSEVLLPREYLGCVLMLAAVVIAQLPAGKKKAEITEK